MAACCACHMPTLHLCQLQTVCRDACFRGNPTALAASSAARAASDGLHALVHNYHDPPMARIRHHTQVLH